jgi:hypothetical protein
MRVTDLDEMCGSGGESVKVVRDLDTGDQCMVVGR